MKQVIAHYSYKVWRHILIVLALSAFPALVTAFVLSRHSTSDLAHSADGLYIIPTLIIIWIAGLFLLAVSLMVLKQVAFRHMEAVWIENGKLVYLSPVLFAIRVDSIDGISRNPFGKILILLKSGRRTELPTRSLREDPGLIEDELRQTIGS